MAYELEELARRAGIKVAKLLQAIEQTQSLEDDLFHIIRPVVEAYQAAGANIAANWTAAQLTQQVVESILATHLANAQMLEALHTTDVAGWANRVESWHRNRWVGVVRGGVRLDITPILDTGAVRPAVEASTQRNVALIRGLSDDMEKRIRETVWTAYQDGTTNRELGKQLTANMGFAKTRARTIARDQLAKFADALDSARFAEAGLEYYKWKTVGDEVVRPSHVANNGKRFRNDKPPPITGHPGHDINCRCKRQAVIYTAEEQAEVDAAEAAARA